MMVIPLMETVSETQVLANQHVAFFCPFLFVLSWSNQAEGKTFYYKVTEKLFSFPLPLMMEEAGCQYYLQPTPGQVGSQFWNEANSVALRGKKPKEPTFQLILLRS